MVKFDLPPASEPSNSSLTDNNRSSTKGQYAAGVPSNSDASQEEVDTRFTDRERKLKTAKSAWLPWVQKYAHNEENGNKIIDAFEETYPNYDVDHDAEPVNILCLDGGGMKGYAICSIFEAIQEKYGGDDRCDRDILSYFDLIAGASIGGGAAVALHFMKNLPDGIEEVRDSIDEGREFVLAKVNLLRILTEGSALKKKNQPLKLTEHNWGKFPFLNPEAIPAMVVTSMRIIEKGFKRDIITHEELDTLVPGKEEDIHPLVLRSYEYPLQPGNTTDALVQSSCEATAAEAAAGTGSMPAIMERVRTKVNNNLVSLADGALFANCPLAIAVDEARRLYPKRPLGVVMSIGFIEDGNPDVEKIKRTVRVMKDVNPKLHFHRIVPHHITSKVGLVEQDLKILTVMEEEVKNFMLNNEEVSSHVDATMNSLFSQQRSPSKYSSTAEKGTFTYNRRKRMLSDKNYIRRCRQRAKIRDKYYSPDEKKGSCFSCKGSNQADAVVHGSVKDGGVKSSEEANPKIKEFQSFLVKEEDNFCEKKFQSIKVKTGDAVV